MNILEIKNVTYNYSNSKTNKITHFNLALSNS